MVPLLVWPMCVCVHARLLSISDVRGPVLLFSGTLRDAHTSRRVPRGVKELRRPLSQSYWAVMTLEVVGFFLSTSLI